MRKPLLPKDIKDPKLRKELCKAAAKVIQTYERGIAGN